MANPFYNASGNPGTGSEGLSATIRAEFLSIQTAFDLVPRISTTGLFDTVFAQTGSYTFTLPNGNGTLATTANVATETTRATTAEGVLTAAISAETTRATAAEALRSPIASPAFTGTPTAPTAAPGTNTTQVSTTAFSAAAIAVETSRAQAAEALLAPKASPALTGTPTAPTASPGTNTTQVATTAFATAADVAAAAVAAAKSFPVALGTLGTGTTITGTNAGTFYNVGGSSTTQTLNTATFTAGQTIGFLAQSACTIATSSGAFYGGSLSGSSIVMGVGTSVALEWDGVNWRQLAGSFATSTESVQVYATAGTFSFTVPDNVTKIDAIVVGSGSGGQSSQAVGSTQVSCGAGGNSGSWGRKLCTVTPGASITVVVGAAGTSNVNGATSSFGAFVSAPGGHAVGAAAPVSPPPLVQSPASPSSVSSGGDVNGAETAGSISASGSSANGVGGNGAPGPWGGGGGGSQQAIGGSALAPGAGGGGSSALGGLGTGSAFAGGSGGAGVVLLRWSQ